MMKKTKPWMLNDVSEVAKDIVRTWSIEQNKKFGIIIEELILKEYSKNRKSFFDWIFGGLK